MGTRTSESSELLGIWLLSLLEGPWVLKSSIDSLAAAIAIVTLLFVALDRITHESLPK